jgi:hypothetical protein
VKETYFFSQGCTGDTDEDREQYASFFSPQPDTRVVFEASPNYLAYKENIAPRIKRILPDVKLLFVLRNPVDRLYSYFNFARGKLQLPKSMTFEEYIEACESFNQGKLSPDDSGILETHLRGLEIGNYGVYLQNYIDVFGSENIKVVFFDELNRQPRKILAEICEFIGVTPSFYDDFSLNRANVTFSAKMKLLHYFALLFNRLLESVLRQRPNLKRRLVYIYKFFNQGQEGYVPMLDETREKLIQYYAPSNVIVSGLLKEQPQPPWIDIKKTV